MDNDTKAAVMAALEFYADEYNYAPDISEVIGVNPGTGTMQCDISNIEADEGERAIDALKLIKRDEDKITNPAVLTAAFRGVVDRTSPPAAMTDDEFHDALEIALVQSDNDARERAAADQQRKR